MHMACRTDSTEGINKLVERMEEKRNNVVVRVLTRPPQIHFEDPWGLSSRQRRKHEETRKRKGRK